MKINELLNKKYNYETKYQRNDAWTKQTQNLLIDSIMNDYYIPNLLIANNEVIDGKQRLITIKKFFKSEFGWKNVITNEVKFYNNFSWEEQVKFNNFEIEVKDLGHLSEDKIIELFLRINNGSIKLNKAELRLAKALPYNRELIKDIAKNENIKKLTNNKKNDKRFKLEELITRCLSTIHIPNNKKDVRTYMDEILLCHRTSLELDEIKNKSHRTIDTMYQILNEDTIPIKSFNTIFEAVFCALYQKIKSQSCFLINKETIKNEIKNKIFEISQDQMGGGTKFDNKDFVFKRVEKISKILENFENDKRRAFTHDERLELWSNNEHKCNLCSTKITSINDFEIDHIKPYSIGGQTNLKNARILCKRCNKIEGIKVREEIRQKKL